jgi:AraC-like DNA-binding protein
MSDASESGVLYTEHAGPTAATPLASLWSYESRERERGRRSVTPGPDGSREYWLERWDPLLNTMLPGTHVSLVINLADAWAAGRSLATSALLPRACVVGPFTAAHILRVGRTVRAVGAVLPPALTPDLFGVPASELVDRVVPLDELWPRDEVERLLAALAALDARRGAVALRGEVAARIGRARCRPGVGGRDAVGRTAPRLIALHAGRVSVEVLARGHGLTRQQFARRFAAAAGVPPKLFARITRFQSLVHALLATDVSRWAALSPALGFYDQAHMINEFRAFAGAPPTVFFRPHGGDAPPASVTLRGRPCEWPGGAGRSSR